MSFEIIDFITTKPVKNVAAQFSYKGFTISLSTAFKSSGAPAAFKGDTFLTADTVEELLNKVDNYNSPN